MASKITSDTLQYTVLLAGKPVPVRNIYCVGWNYAAHVRELDNPEGEEPLFFQKALTSLSSERRIELPAGREIHYELEIVALIGAGGEHLSARQARKLVAGLALGLDLTDRPLQSRYKTRGQPWFLSKSFRGSAVVTDFETPDWERWSQEFWLRINGRRAQKGHLANMVLDIPHLVEYLSARVPLLEGDLLFTGTPEGVGPLHTGDRLELGLGEETRADLEVL